MRQKALLVICALAIFSLGILAVAGSASPAAGQDLTVSAAISLKNAFQEITPLFGQAHPGVQVRFNFGASGALAQQIKGGAPVDVFASAAPKDMDELAAAGRYAHEALAFFQMLEPVRDKLVLAENVRQVLDYVARGEVEAGVVYHTDALTRPREVKVVATAPQESHKPVLYPAAVLKQSNNDVAAREFVAALTLPQTREIFRKFGFREPPAR